MCNIPTLLHKGTKTVVILRCGWLFLAHSKLIKLHIFDRVFPTGGMGESPPTSQKSAHPRPRKVPPVDSPIKFIPTTKGQSPVLKK